MFRSVKRLLRSMLSLARMIAFWYMGTAIETRMEMIVITIRISISVKPLRWRTAFVVRLPFRISRPIGRFVRTLGEHIENVLSAPTRGIRIVARTAQSPFERVREGVLRNAAQEPQLLVGAAVRAHAVDELLEAFRGAVAVHLPFREHVGVGGVLVLVDRRADLAQGVPQVPFPLAAHLEARDRNRHGGEEHQDRESHDQLDQGQPALVPPSHTYRMVTLARGTSSETGWLCESRAARSEKVTSAAPGLIALKVKTASAPVPFRPVESGMRFRCTVASPVSFRMLRVKMIFWLSLERKPPAATSSRRSSCGSNFSLNGAAYRSRASLTSNWIVNVWSGFTSIVSGLSRRRVPGPGAGAGGAGVVEGAGAAVSGAGAGLGPSADAAGPGAAGDGDRLKCVFCSVPAAIALILTSVIPGVRTMCGISAISNSFLSFSTVLLVNSFPRSGILDSPGTPLTLLMSWSSMRPPSRLTSPSRMRISCSTLRWPMMGWVTPPTLTSPLWVEISRTALRVTSLSP